MTQRTQHFMEPRENPKRLSLVIPIYNEEESIPFLQEELLKFKAKLPAELELVLINDGSQDRSLQLLKCWADEDKMLKLLSFSRNFGHQIAVSAGLKHATGEAVVILDADLQDPPDVIFEMLEAYREGYDVIYGQREERSGEGLFKKFSAWVFYRLMRTFVHNDLPVDSGDFRLISKPVLQEMNALQEKHRFLRGLYTWCGFPQKAISYKRQARVAGRTKYPLRKMLSFAWTAAVSFSTLPLQISFVFGLLISCFGFLFSLYAVVRYFYSRYFAEYAVVFSPGWTTLVVLICVIGGAILMSLGVLGTYVARVYEEVKGRPLYIISYSQNVK